jgi:hypothetical protein
VPFTGVHRVLLVAALLATAACSTGGATSVLRAGAPAANRPRTTATITPSYVRYDSLNGYTPSGGSFYYYPSSPYHVAIPQTPAFVSNTQSTAWNAMQNAQTFSGIIISEDGTNVNDGSEPTTYTNGDGTSYVLACDKDSYSASSCANPANVRDLNGAVVAFPLGVVAEGSSDHHVVNIDTAGGIEDDIWEGQPLPAQAGQTWPVGGAGECALSGNGVGCGGATATNIVATLGLVRAEDILYCLQVSSAPTTCVLPYAVSVALACNGPGIEFPATASDAQCGAGKGSPSTRIAEGTRGCLDLTDTQINAGPYRNYEKVIYRTMDCSHYGVFDRDTAYSGGPGLSVTYQGGQAYAAFGETDPWATLANFDGIPRVNTADYVFPMSLSNPPFHWCANANADGLCD